MSPNNSEIIIYQTEDLRTKISVRMEDETVWLTQMQMVELFQSSKPNISEHIRHIFDEGELAEEAVVRIFRIYSKRQQIVFFHTEAQSHKDQRYLCDSVPLCEIFFGGKTEICIRLQYTCRRR